jgi:hypothetical protein
MSSEGGKAACLLLASCLCSRSTHTPARAPCSTVSVSGLAGRCGGDRPTDRSADKETKLSPLASAAHCPPTAHWTHTQQSRAIISINLPEGSAA